MIRFSLHFVREMVPERPAGYYQDVVSQGTIEGDEISFADEAYEALKIKYGRIVEYSLTDLLSNFAATVGAWRAAGCPVVDEQALKARAGECFGCAEWSGWNCRICGCLKLKHYMATAHCPIGKWGAIPAPQ